jgi:integrase
MTTRKYGTGSIHRDKGRGGWVAQVSSIDPLTGKRTYRRKRAKTRDEARDALKVLLDAEPVKRPEGTLAGYLEDWAARRLPNTALSPKTKGIYADVLTWYAVPAAGKVRLADFTPEVAEEWLAAVRAIRKNAPAVRDAEGNVTQEAGRHGGPIGEATVRKTYNATVKALDTAVTDGLIASNPLRSVDRPSQRRPQVPVADEDHTAAAIEATRDMRVGPLVVVVAYTGMRLGEALGLRWEDVDLRAGTATIRRSAADTDRTKTGRTRTVPLVPEAVEALHVVRTRQRAERLAVGPGWSNPGGLVFTTATGGPVDAHNARRDLQRALKSAGLEAARPYHSFRHGLATRLLRSGVPMPIVAAILGHSGIQITVDTYGHLDAAVPASVISDALASGEARA